MMGRLKQTRNGPSSNPIAKTPAGASQISFGARHLYVEEQTTGPVGSTPTGYTGFCDGWPVDTGIFGILPAATAALRAATQGAGSWVVSIGGAGGKPLAHSDVEGKKKAGQGVKKAHQQNPRPRIGNHQ